MWAQQEWKLLGFFLVFHAQWRPVAKVSRVRRHCTKSRSQWRRLVMRCAKSELRVRKTRLGISFLITCLFLGDSFFEGQGFIRPQRLFTVEQHQTSNIKHQVRVAHTRLRWRYGRGKPRSQRSRSISGFPKSRIRLQTSNIKHLKSDLLFKNKDDQFRTGV